MPICQIGGSLLLVLGKSQNCHFAFRLKQNSQKILICILKKKNNKISTMMKDLNVLRIKEKKTSSNYVSVGRV